MDSEETGHEGGSSTVIIDGVEFKVERHRMRVAQLLALVDKSPDEWEVDAELSGGDRVTLGAGDDVTLKVGGFVAFRTRRRGHHHHHHGGRDLTVVVNSDPVALDVRRSTPLNEVVKEALAALPGEGDQPLVVVEEIIIDIEDLEECGKTGREPRRAKRYRIVIDRIEKIVHQHEMTGREILALVGKAPEGFTLTEKLHGGTRVRIEPHEAVIFHRHKVERFETAPKSANNGEVPLRGPLTADDVEYLAASGYDWRLVPFSGAGAPGAAGHALILSGYRLPSAFTPCVVNLMIRIPALYPATPLDMFNTFPHVSRADRSPLAYVTLFPFEGQQWQQWSRHRKPEQPWDPAVDSLATHMALVESALANDAR